VCQILKLVIHKRNYTLKAVLDELIALADKEQLRIECSLPEDSLTCLGLFVESVRVLDFMMLGQPGVSKSEKIPFSASDLNIIEMGWNLATAMLLKASNFHGFPMMQSTDESRKHIISLLYQLGIIVQVRRTVDMIKAGMVNVYKDGTTYTFSHTPEAKDQFLDELELGFLKKMEDKLKASGTTYNSWELVNRKDIEERFRKVGNFMSVSYETEFASYKIQEIDSHMIPLIKQWNSGRHGIMMGYDSTPEIDNHFLALSAEIMRDWKDEAGINPSAKIGDIVAAEIMGVAMIVASFHFKHISFARLASEKHLEILIPQSLSIWKPTHELIKDISDFTSIDQKSVKEAIDAITLKSNDVEFLKRHTTRFRPLLIEIGNGFVLRPVSSVLRNPLHSIYTLLESRDLSLSDRISNYREEWLRLYLNAIFAGTRYQRAEWNIRIRKDGNLITDVDAFIYDNLSGELALIQIKWQNYFTNDVKKLRSRAKNFVDEISMWTEKMIDWISCTKISQIIKTFQLKNSSNNLSKSKIYLFGLSKNSARMQGYGYKLNTEKIAVGTWAQFARHRTEIGPAPLVISKLFQSLKEEEYSKINSKPMPVKIPFSHFTLDFKDIWSVIEE
jgi:hypothetical protein